jgi:hypothetical protein
VWEHPSFEDEKPEESVLAKYTSQTESETWIRAFIDRSDCCDYDHLMGAIAEAERGGYDSEFLTIYGQDAHGSIPANFWRHVEAVLGRKLKFKTLPTYFSCSC